MTPVVRVPWFLIGMAAALVAGWVVFPAVLYRTVDQPLQFSHRVHAGESVGLPCENCHTVGDDGRFTGIPGVAKCAECHEEALTDLPHELLLVEEYVKPNREIPWLVYARQPQNAHFPHAQHTVRGGLSCERCHGDHGSSDSLRPFQQNRISGYSRDVWGRSIARVGMPEWEGMKMDDCAACHRERGVGNTCLKCHK